MSVYRISRNLEASIIDFVKESLEASPYSWEDINIIKGFNKVYELELPTVAIRAENTIYTKVEIGSNNFTRTVQVFVDIFADSDGLRLDLKDAIIEILKNGLVYYEYTITKGGKVATSSSQANGRIRIIKIDDTPLNFAIEKSKLETHDKFRHLLTLSVNIGKVE